MQERSATLSGQPTMDPASRRRPPRRRTEKKKTQDRLAQRALREKTKERIAELEKAVQQLASEDQKSNLAALMQSCTRLRENNRLLRGVLHKVHDALMHADLFPPNDEEEDSVEPVSHSSDALTSMKRPSTIVSGIEPSIIDGAEIDCGELHFSEGTSILSATLPATEPIAMDQNDLRFQSQSHSMPPEKDRLEEYTPTVVNLVTDEPDYVHDAFCSATMLDAAYPMGRAAVRSMPRELQSVTLSLAADVVPDAQKWYEGNSAYFSALDGVKSRSATAANMDFQIAFEATLWGWDAVHYAAQHPVWKALRQVDQRIFGNWTSIAQRVAMMYVCQTLIQYREMPTRDNLERVPDFLRPRPSQERIDHPVVVDFLIWPGMRDRMVFEHQQYSANALFSKAYVENFTFHWPFAASYIFWLEPTRHRYELSPLFLSYVYDFRNWGMKSPFFEAFPEMQYDVLALEQATATDGLSTKSALSWGTPSACGVVM